MTAWDECTVVAERRVRRQVDVLLLAVCDKIILREKRVRLDLVRGRVDTGSLVDALDHLNCEVGDTDSLNLAGIKELKDCLPGIGERDILEQGDAVLAGCKLLARHECDGPVNDYSAAGKFSELGNTA